MVDFVKRMGYTSKRNLVERIKGDMDADRFVGGAEIAFIRQFDTSFADQCAEYRLERLAKIEQKHRDEYAERERERQAELTEKQKEIEAEHAKYFGWGKTISPMQFGRAKKTLEKKFRHNGKVMTSREIIISLIKDGRKPFCKEYDSTKVYGLSCPDQNLFMEVNKTEYNFAEYLFNNKEALS